MAHIRQLTTACNSSSRGPYTLLWPSWTLFSTYTHIVKIIVFLFWENPKVQITFITFLHYWSVNEMDFWCLNTLRFIIYFMCMSILPACIYVYHICVCLCLWKSEEDTGSHGTGVADSWEPPCRYWNLVPLKEQGILTTELSFQPQV